MAKKNLLKSINYKSISLKSSAMLKEMQSTRATFKLTTECIEAISIVSAQLGIKQKSLFDHLVQDVESLNTIGKEIRNVIMDQKKRIQKTFVISKKSMTVLNEMAKKYNTPREALIEFSVQRLLPIIDMEREKNEIRKDIFSKVERHSIEGNHILDEIENKLGTEDPIYKKLKNVMDSYLNVKKSIARFLKKTKNIEDFNSKYLDKIDVEFKK